MQPRQPPTPGGGGRLAQLTHNKPLMIAAGAVALVAVFVVVKRGGGGGLGAAGDGPAGTPGDPAALATYGSDVAQQLGQYGESLQRQLDEYRKTLTDSLDAARRSGTIPRGLPPTTPRGNPIPPVWNPRGTGPGGGPRPPYTPYVPGFRTQ